MDKAEHGGLDANGFFWRIRTCRQGCAWWAQGHYDASEVLEGAQRLVGLTSPGGLGALAVRVGPGEAGSQGRAEDVSTWRRLTASWARQHMLRWLTW